MGVKWSLTSGSCLLPTMSTWCALCKGIVAVVMLYVDLGGIVVRILHHVHQVHDECIFIAVRLFQEKAAWVHQAHETEELKLFYRMIGLTCYEKATSCT